MTKSEECYSSRMNELIIQNYGQNIYTKARREAEILIMERKQLGRSFNIYMGIDKLLILLAAVSAGLMIYYWIKSRN